MAQKHEKAVSVRAVTDLLDGARRLKLPEETVFEIFEQSGLDPKLVVANPRRERIHWESLCNILEGFKAHFGEEVLEKLCLNAPQLEGNRDFSKVMGSFTDSKQIFWIVARWVVPSMFRIVKTDFQDLGDRHVRFTVEIPEPHRACELYFRVFIGALQSTPLALGQPDAIVKAELSPRKGVFDITLPPAMTLIGRLRRLWKTVVSRKGAIEELIHQQRELKHHYEKLADAQKKLIEQEVRLQLSERMSALSKMSGLGEMAGGIAHEINNPLTIICAKIALCQKALQREELDRERLKFELGKIENTAMRISKIIHGLRAFARDATHDPFQSATAQNVLNETLELCREKILSSGIELEETVPKDPIEIECKPTQVSQVLMNLISNAIDAVREKEQKKIKVRIENDPDRVRYIVEDSGPGIPLEIREKIFQPFFTTKPLGRGTGLGLSISRGLIESHHGRLYFDEDSGHARFVAELPRHQPAEAPLH